jgi:hypothetical protein
VNLNCKTSFIDLYHLSYWETNFHQNTSYHLMYTYKMSNNLNAFRKNIYTNFGVKPCPGYGEDGVLVEVFDQIGISQKPLCVEFGELRVLGTTTRSFRIRFLAKALYFSGSMDKYSHFLNLLDIFKITLKHRNFRYLKFLRNQPKKIYADTKNINSIVENFAKGRDIDLMVVDIDSFDFELVSQLLTLNCKPRVLVVEYNPSIPKSLSIYLTEESAKLKFKNRRVYGASYSAWENLMTKHNYSLIHISGFCNLHYIRGNINHNFEKPNLDLEITDTNEKVLSFAQSYCLPGFLPSWINEPLLTNSEIEIFAKYQP